MRGLSNESKMTEVIVDCKLIDEYFPETIRGSSLLNINLDNGLVERWSPEKDRGYIAGNFTRCGENYRDFVLRRQDELLARRYKVNLYINDAENKVAVLAVGRE